MQNINNDFTYSLSEEQKRIYLLDILSPKKTEYNIVKPIKITGNINLTKIRKAFLALIDRHEILRTTFSMNNNEIVQVVHKEGCLNFNVQNVDLEEEAISLNYLKKQNEKPFKLKKLPLFYVHVYMDKYATSYMVITFHHIIIDGLGLEIFLEELMKLYFDIPIDPLVMQYKEYVDVQNQIDNDLLANQEKFWMDMYNGFTESIGLPLDFDRSCLLNYSGTTKNYQLDKEKIYKLAKLIKITPFQCIMALISLSIMEICGKTDIVLGMTSNQRGKLLNRNILGVFVNLLAIRFKGVNEQTFAEYSNNCSRLILSAMQNQDFQFDMLLKRLSLSRSKSRNPLFNVLVNHQFTNIEHKSEIGNLVLEPFELDDTSSAFDLEIYVYIDKEIKLKLRYYNEIITDESIETFMNKFGQSLENCANNPNKKLFCEI